MRNSALARFCAVGLLCFIVGLGVLVGLHELLGVYYLIAYAAAFFVTNSFGYLLNGRYAFRAPRVDRAGALRYMTVNAGLLAINSLLLRILVENFHLWYLTGTLILAAVNTPISFVAHGVLSYRTGRWARAASASSAPAP